MQCGVTIAVEIAPEAEMSQMEAAIQEAVRHAMRKAFKQAVRSYEAALTQVPVLEETLHYLKGQCTWLGNYAAWQQQGYPVGSGLSSARSRSSSIDA